MLEMYVNEEWTEGMRRELVFAMVDRRDAVVDKRRVAVSRVALL